MSKLNVVSPTCLQWVFKVLHEESDGHSTAAAPAQPGNYQDTRSNSDVWIWKYETKTEAVHLEHVQVTISKKYLAKEKWKQPVKLNKAWKVITS